MALPRLAVLQKSSAGEVLIQTGGAHVPDVNRGYSDRRHSPAHIRLH
jgi:hypothetical protein